jgi:hypothetical protein
LKKIPVVRQIVVDVLADALVGTPVTTRATPRVHPLTHLVRPPPTLGLLVAEPRLDLIAGALEEASVLAAPVPAAVIRFTVSAFITSTVFAFITSLVVRLACAVAVFITAVIVSAVRLGVRPAAVSAPVGLAVVAAPARAVTPFAALASVIRLFIALRGAALAPVIWLIVIPLIAAPLVVIIIVLVRHLVSLKAKLIVLVCCAVKKRTSAYPTPDRSPP